MLIVNCINITAVNKDNYQLFRKAVSEERRIKADRFYFIDDSKRSLCAELLLQYSLFQATGEFVEMDIGYNKFGKPFIRHRNDFFYNISHSGNWVVIVYGNTEVGIDIEKIETGKEDIVDKFFTDEEKRFIHGATKAEQAKRFIQIWTLKESYIKYLGTGLSTNLKSFSVNAIDYEVTDQNGENNKDVKLKSYLFDTDYYLSVCSNQEDIYINEIMVEGLIQFVMKI